MVGVRRVALSPAIAIHERRTLSIGLLVKRRAAAPTRVMCRSSAPLERTQGRSVVVYVGDAIHIEQRLIISIISGSKLGGRPHCSVWNGRPRGS